MGNRTVYAGFVSVYAFMHPLDVTLNELFAGERIAEEKWKRTSRRGSYGRDYKLVRTRQ